MLEAIEASYFGKMLVTFVVSMAPVVELRGGIPFGAALGLDPLSAAAAALSGSSPRAAPKGIPPRSSTTGAMETTKVTSIFPK